MTTVATELLHVNNPEGKGLHVGRGEGSSLYLRNAGTELVYCTAPDDVTTTLSPGEEVTLPGRDYWLKGNTLVLVERRV